MRAHDVLRIEVVARVSESDLRITLPVLEWNYCEGQELESFVERRMAGEIEAPSLISYYDGP